ncbi:hypothetical protein EII13_07405 [Buchananella hordeovulneris]|nr:hypothetical protein EII13_07405 [Buchananella hordeovulneris]
MRSVMSSLFLVSVRASRPRVMLCGQQSVGRKAKTNGRAESRAATAPACPHFPGARGHLCGYCVSAIVYPGAAPVGVPGGRCHLPGVCGDRGHARGPRAAPPAKVGAGFALMAPSLPAPELDGRPVTAAQLTNLALTGYGHFTTMCLTARGVRGLTLHLERLAADCAALFGVTLDVEHVRACLRRWRGQQAVVRVTIFDPQLHLGNLAAPAHPAVLLTARPLPPGSPLRLATARGVRSLPHRKHLGMCPALWAARTARLAGADDALLLTATGHIAELTTANLGMVRDGTLTWAQGASLAGVTQRLLDAALPGRTRYQPLRVADLPGADLVLATNAVAGVRAVTHIDGQELPSGQAVQDWLTQVYRTIPEEQP